MRSRRLTAGLLLAVVAVFLVSLWLGSGSGDFGGTDAAATGAIEETDPSYRPWFSLPWRHPGGEVESGLFALQAALGAGVVGFALGTLRERRRTGATREVDRQVGGS